MLIPFDSSSVSVPYNLIAPVPALASLVVNGISICLCCRRCPYRYQCSPATTHHFSSDRV